MCTFPPAICHKMFHVSTLTLCTSNLYKHSHPPVSHMLNEITHNPQGRPSLWGGIDGLVLKNHNNPKCLPGAHLFSRLFVHLAKISKQKHYWKMSLALVPIKRQNYSEDAECVLILISLSSAYRPGGVVQHLLGVTAWFIFMPIAHVDTNSCSLGIVLAFIADEWHSILTTVIVKI